MSEMTCEASWEFDVDFSATCRLMPGHTGTHLALIRGNGDVLANVTWHNPKETR